MYYDPTDPPLPDLTSRPGDWLYGKVPGGRFKDMSKFFPGRDFPQSGAPLVYLVALMIIKMRILAQHDATMAILNVFQNTRFGSYLPKPLRAILGTFLVYPPSCISDQETQLKHLLESIHKRNPSMLPSFVNPGPMKSQPCPQFQSIGGPSEAWFVLNESSRCVARVPGAHERIRSIVGDNPTYDVNMSPYH